VVASAPADLLLSKLRLAAARASPLGSDAPSSPASDSPNAGPVRGTGRGLPNGNATPVGTPMSARLSGLREVARLGQTTLVPCLVLWAPLDSMSI
jgi:hypothetical protein